MRGAAGKCDPSRGAARGTRVGGRGGRDDPRCCADGAPGRCGSTAGGRPCGRASSSRRGRGRMTRKRRMAGGTRGRSSYGAADPRRRSSQGDLRLDNEPQPWHKGTGRPALSELGAVTRVRWARPGPSPYDCVRFGDYIRVPAGLADLTRKWGSSLRRPPHFGQPLGQGRSRACVRAVSRSPCAPLPARRNGQRTSVFGAPILAGLQCEGLGRPAAGPGGRGLSDVRLEIELVGADGAATTGDAVIGRCRPRQTGVFRRSTAWVRRRAPRSMASYRIRSPIRREKEGDPAHSSRIPLPVTPKVSERGLA